MQLDKNIYLCTVENNSIYPKNHIKNTNLYP